MLKFLIGFIFLTFSAFSNEDENSCHVLQEACDENLLILAQSNSLECIAKEIVKTNFPVRLTPEEEAEQDSLDESMQSCCNPTGCNPVCCPPPSMNCPPIHPRCNPCDCIIDYFNPLIFNGFELSAEWLFWTVQQKASTFAITDIGIGQGSPSTLTADAIGKYKSNDFGWSPGVRVALGYTFERDAWNILTQYTYYDTSESDSAKRSDDPTLYLESPNRMVSLSTNGVDRINSSMKFNYQAADLFLSRRFLPACQILLNFFAGPTGAWIYEKWKIKALDNAGTDPIVETNITNIWHFYGGGMRGGLHADWHMGKGFALFNKFSFATLVGSYLNRKKTEIIATGSSNSTINALLLPEICKTIEEEIWVVPTTQMEFGINWNHRFCQWAVALQLGFEINTWYDLHQYHQDGFNTSIATQDKLDYRNASPVSLWGTSLKIDFSF